VRLFYSEVPPYDYVNHNRSIRTELSRNLSDNMTLTDFLVLDNASFR
jgi:hypothetical protein